MHTNDEYEKIQISQSEPMWGAQVGIQGLWVHKKGKCAGEHCSIHNPSDHHMKEWPLNWRSDSGVMERICPHGVGHPDPDHMDYVISLDRGLEYQGVHGCDGCCRD